MIPQAVQQQRDASQALHSQVYAQNAAPTDAQNAAPTDAQSDADNLGSADNPIDLNISLATPSASGAPNPPGTAANPTAEPGADGTPSPAKPEPESIDWEQRFKTLQGKYNAEVPQLHQQNRQLQSQLYAERTAPPMPAQPAQDTPVEASETFEKLVTDTDLEDFGESTIDVIRRAAREEIHEAMQKLRAENDQLKTIVQNTQNEISQTSYQRMLENLDQNVSGWRETNHDPKFLDWLENVDPLSGQPRKTLLNNAVNHHDPVRVESFFKEYGKQQTSPAVSTSTPQSSVNLNTLIAPGTPTDGQATSANAPDSIPQGKQWTRGEIQEFYRNAQRGSYQPDEYNRLASDISLASKEGRIIG